jgi:hypothetical protein
MNFKLTYGQAAGGCFLHALFLSVSLYCLILSGWKYFQIGIWVWSLLLIGWPVWAILLWKGAEGKLWRVVSPMLASSVVLLPSFFLLLWLYMIRHAKHI